MSQLQRDIEPKKERGFFGRLFNRGETQTSSQPGLDYSRKIGAKEMVTKKDITADQATKKVIEDKKYYDYASLKKEISVAIARDVS